MSSGNKKGRHDGQGRAAGQSDAGAYRTAVDYIADAPPPRPAAFVPFPIDLLPSAAAAIVRAGAESIDCDPSFLALPALAALGGTIGNRRHALVKPGWTEPPNVWAMLVSPSGTAKTPAAKIVLTPVHDRHARLIAAIEAAAKAHAAELQRHDAKMAKWRQTPDADPPERPDPPPAERAVVEDTTIEALAGILKDNPAGVLLHRDELAGWFGSFDRYAKQGQSDQSRWESVFSGQPITVDRRTSGTIHVPRPAVSVFGGVQPARLPKLLTAGVRGGGLLARLLIAAPPPRPKRFNVAGPDAVAVEGWRRLLNYLATLEMTPDAEGRPTPVLIPMTSEAQAAFAKWADAHNAATLAAGDDEAAARSKLEAYAVRFSLILAVCEPSARVEAGHVRRGCALADWFAAEAARLYDTVGYAAADADAAELAGWIERQGGRATLRMMTGSGLRQYRGKSAELTAVLGRLEAAGRGRWRYDVRRPGQTGQDTRWFTLTERSGNGFAADDPARAESDSTTVAGEPSPGATNAA